MSSVYGVVSASPFEDLGEGSSSHKMATGPERRAAGDGSSCSSVLDGQATMTKDQIRLLRYWICALGCMLTATCISLLDSENEPLAWFILMTLFGFVSLFQDLSYYRGFGDGNRWMGEFIARHPVLKIWMLAYCAVMLPFLLYMMQTREDLSAVFYYASFSLLLGPVAVTSELERFRSMAEPDT